ncbi:MAG: argininosuccinate lyase [Hungatella sp.]|nr:argininosuccinate lyase [Hungatella sp.]
MISKEAVLAKDGAGFPGLSFQKNSLKPIFDLQKTYYYRIFIEVTKAHVVMLHEQELMTGEEAKVILSAMAELEKIPMEESEYNPEYEDLFFRFEKELENRIGSDLAGKVHTARSRNDICVGEFRMVLREKLLKLGEGLNYFREALLYVAGQNLETVMPMYTHTQPAQPSTLGHYLLSMADVMERDFKRLLAAHETINMSPFGAAAITTTGFPISRERVCGLLGFDRLCENSYDSISASDHMTQFAAVMMEMAVNLSRFIKDLLDWCTAEFGFFRLSDPYVQISSIMPQKRNPSSLEHCRPILGKALAEASAVFTVQHNSPYGDIVDSEEDLQSHLYDGVSYLTRAMEIMANVISTMDINRELLKKRAGENFITATELADTFVRESGLTFRNAHRLTSAIVRRLYREGKTAEDITREFCEQVSGEVLGKRAELPIEKIRMALDPVHFVKIRDRTGGPALSQVLRMHEERLETLKEQEKQLADIRAGYERAHEMLALEVERRVRGSEAS